MKEIDDRIEAERARRMAMLGLPVAPEATMAARGPEKPICARCGAIMDCGCRGGCRKCGFTPTCGEA